MKAIKKMLLGIAFLIVSVIGSIFWMAGIGIASVFFFLGLILGIFFTVDGYLSVEK